MANVIDEDYEKLLLIQGAISRKIGEIQTWAAFKTFMGNITKTKVKMFILNSLSSMEISQDNYVADVESVWTEIDNDI